MPDFFPIRCGAHFFLGSFIRCLARAERLRSSKEEQRYSWPLATASPEDTVTQLFAEKFAEEVHDLSNGAMRIQVYANSTLGGDRDLLENVRGRRYPICRAKHRPSGFFHEDLAVFDLPCVFDSLDDCRKKLDDPDFYNLISQVYTDGGYHLLGMADQGFRIMSTNKPVYSLADFKGQKIRTMENSYHLAFWKAIGANPTPMTFSEVYIGLQQHTIDAQENPYESSSPTVSTNSRIMWSRRTTCRI